MSEAGLSVTRTRPWDLWAITTMSYENMIPVDRGFARMVSNPLLRLGGYLFWPLYFLIAGRGYKVELNNRIAGYAFLYLRRRSGVIFNVGVNPPFRRRGVAQVLLQHMEQTTHERGRSWVALQVDRENTPARRLYEKEAYRPINPYFWIGHVPPGHVPPGVEVARLPARSGRRLFWRHNCDEFDAGETWAAGVLKHEYNDPPAGGQFWHCLWHREQIGCAWTGRTRGRPAVILLLKAEYWRRSNLTAGWLRALAHEMNTRELHVTLGSSAHFSATATLMHEWHFQQREQPRLLMLKRVS